MSCFFTVEMRDGKPVKKVLEVFQPILGYAVSRILDGCFAFAKELIDSAYKSKLYRTTRHENLAQIDRTSGRFEQTRSAQKSHLARLPRRCMHSYRFERRIFEERRKYRRISGHFQRHSEEEKGELKIHTAGAVAKLAYGIVKKQYVDDSSQKISPD